LIDSGETWLQPLLDYRNLLSSTQDPAVKEKYRDYKLRRGVVLFKKNYEGEIIHGPYKFEFRKELLERLLRVQKEVREIGPDPNIELISKAELEKIRQIWRAEEGDWVDSAPLIYMKVFNDIYWDTDDNNPFNRYDKQELIQLAEKFEVPERLVTKLIDLELQTQGMSIRYSIFKNMDNIFNEEWRSEEEMLEEYRCKRSEVR